MGIPETSIILEKQANSCYENVKYTSRILREKGFDKIILISSPYNMRRAYLVYQKEAQDIQVKYVPVPNPQFYKRDRRIRLSQIKAIAHEYIGILYYYIKGYI